ncbi:MAG: NUDIX domain-containing protein, partial [Ghiorsea sp.]|nr:NUDIX domain-containing protein [Ghiorsea sp.]
GYYRRARFIHEAAQRIMDEFNGKFPMHFDDILSLKGIGKSTAGAISSFCYRTPTPVLDGNVKRVLSSWQNQVLSDKALWSLAQSYIEQSQTPDIWNQAMMELGASLCGAKKRDCAACPVNSTCQSAFTEPVKKASNIKIKSVHWQVQMFHDENNRIWLTQRPKHGIWAGLWTPPIIELDEKPSHKPEHIHVLTHRRLHRYISPEQGTPTGNGKWFTSWEGLAVPTGIHRLFEQRTT